MKGVIVRTKKVRLSDKICKVTLIQFNPEQIIKYQVVTEQVNGKVLKENFTTRVNAETLFRSMREV